MQSDEELWVNRYWSMDNPPPGATVWAFKVVHFRSVGRFDSLQLPSGITLRLLTRGSGRVVVGGQSLSVAAGDYFCAIPDVLIRFHDTPATPWEWWEWQLKGPGAMAYLEGLGLGRQQAVGRAVRPVEAALCLSQMLAYFDHPSRQPYHALSLLYEIAHHCAPGGSPGMPLSQRENLVNQAQAWIDSRLEGCLNINEVARGLGVDRTTLLRAFRKCLGRTPLEYLQKRRLDKAQELLLATELPVREIARHTGFRTDKYFIRIFREALGATPALWRQRRKHANPDKK